jgi:hypothetical protein
MFKNTNVIMEIFILCLSAYYGDSKIIKTNSLFPMPLALSELKDLLIFTQLELSN